MIIDHVPHQPDHIKSCCCLTSVIKAVRVNKYSVVHAYGAGTVIHHVHKFIFTARNMLGNGNRDLIGG